MTERHFRVVQLDGKKVEFGGVSITSKASPGSAARKLLTSIAHEKGLKKNKKASMPKVKFCIQEYTQGSSKKVYGPYVGHFHKYTAAELKKATTAKGKIKFTMKPVVKLAKGNMKGGALSGGMKNVPPAIINFSNGMTETENKRYIIGVDEKNGLLVAKGPKLANFMSNCFIPSTGYCFGKNAVYIKYHKVLYKFCYNSVIMQDYGVEIIEPNNVHEKNGNVTLKNGSSLNKDVPFLTQVTYDNGTIGNAVKINNQAGVRNRSSSVSTVSIVNNNNNNNNCKFGNPACMPTRNRSREGRINVPAKNNNE